MCEEMSLSFVFIQKARVYRSCLAPIETLWECVSVYPADVKSRKSYFKSPARFVRRSCPWLLQTSRREAAWRCPVTSPVLAWGALPSCAVSRYLSTTRSLCVASPHCAFSPCPGSCARLRCCAPSSSDTRCYSCQHVSWISLDRPSSWSPQAGGCVGDGDWVRASGEVWDDPAGGAWWFARSARSGAAGTTDAARGVERGGMWGASSVRAHLPPGALVWWPRVSFAPGCRRWALVWKNPCSCLGSRTFAVAPVCHWHRGGTRSLRSPAWAFLAWSCCGISQPETRRWRQKGLCRRWCRWSSRSRRSRSGLQLCLCRHRRFADSVQGWLSVAVGRPRRGLLAPWSI